MKKLSFFAAVLLFSSIYANATIRRVGFFGLPSANVDYSTLQAAQDAAANSDTIMMMPGSSVSGNISKVLVIIGPGYFLDPSNTSNPGNAGLQANINSNSTSGNLTFQTGSNSSQVLGCALSNVYTNAGVGNILFKRCCFYNYVYLNGNSSGITFQQCYLNHILSGSYTVTNLSFLNCILYSSYIDLSGGTTTGVISNCIFHYNNLNNNVLLGTGSWQVQNCISQNNIYGTNTVFNNNIGTSTQFPTGNGNQQNKAWNTIFTLTGSADGQFTLKAGSPAIGAGLIGTTATDCGIFGGTTPYRLSGIPPIPTIYSLSSPQGPTPTGNSIQINVSTRSNN